MPKRFLVQIKGAEVVGSQGSVFGNVADLELSETELTALIITVRKSHVTGLGLKKPFWSKAQIVIPLKFVKSIADVVVLSISLKEFASQLSKAKPKESAASRKLVDPSKPLTPSNSSQTTPAKSTDAKKGQQFSTPWQRN